MDETTLSPTALFGLTALKLPPVFRFWTTLALDMKAALFTFSSNICGYT